jgi:hypothetical protein
MTATTPRELRILYYGAGWPTNIGNAFLDLGAVAILRAAAPKARIAFASEMPRWFFSDGLRPAPKRRFGRTSSPRGDAIDNALDVAAVTRCDLVVFSGMAMCDTFVRVNGPSIAALSSRGTPVLLLGTGADRYDARERSVYRDFLRDVKCIGFISRDDRSFEMFQDTVTPSIKGIDCGFFLPHAYSPFALELPPYAVVNFDGAPEPALDLQGLRVIRTHHECFGPTDPGLAKAPDTMISDIPFDYLSLYAQAEEVHSDRVHACVAALAYGRRARLYNATPRGHLFEAAGAGDVRRQLVSLDGAALETTRQAQIEHVRRILELHFGPVDQ